MNIGEKIQICRRNKNMSQEELGQALLVSRQTVSLWETGQTLPTIDNLIRLKEVFGMTLDGILCPEEKEPEANESYSFTCGDNFKGRVASAVSKKRLLNGLTSLIAIAFVSAVSLIFFGAAFINGILIGLLCASVFLFCKYRIEDFKTAKKLCGDEQITYNYSVYDGYILIKSLKNGDEISSVKASFLEISKAYDMGDMLVIEVGGSLYPLEKAQIDGNSKLGRIESADTSMSPVAFSEKLRKTVSVYLTVLSFASVFLAMATIFVMSANGASISENTWVFFAFTPFPLALAIYGIVLKIKKLGGLFGIILGIFLLIVLCFYGSVVFIFGL